MIGAILADPRIQASQLFGNLSAGTSLLSHWRSALSQTQQSRIPLQQDVLGHCGSCKCELKLLEQTFLIMSVTPL